MATEQIEASSEEELGLLQVRVWTTFTIGAFGLQALPTSQYDVCNAIHLTRDIAFQPC
jgi:hypothetical protein